MVLVNLTYINQSDRCSLLFRDSSKDKRGCGSSAVNGHSCVLGPVLGARDTMVTNIVRLPAPMETDHIVLVKQSKCNKQLHTYCIRVQSCAKGYENGKEIICQVLTATQSYTQSFDYLPNYIHMLCLQLGHCPELQICHFHSPIRK